MDILREKFSHMMSDIQALENRLEELIQGKSRKKKKQEEIEFIQNKLAQKRLELARISDGCGTPHSVAETKPKL